MSLKYNGFVCNNVKETDKMINQNSYVANNFIPEELLHHIS